MPGQIPLIGERFPETEVTTTHGVKKLLDDYRGRWFVLFSHPADFTPACTTEFVAFAKRYEDFKLSLIHISEPTRLGMISYAVFCLKKNPSLIPLGQSLLLMIRA